MIKIELQFETGAEARQALQELLGGATGTVRNSDVQAALERSATRDEQIAENFEALKTEEIPTKKRRTKAEIEAANKIAEQMPEKSEEQGSTDIQGEEKPAEETKSTSDEDLVKMLQAKAVELTRAGKKQLTAALLKNQFGADCISPKGVGTPLDPKDYLAVMEAMKAL